jgi:hypothetical protein
MNGQVFTKEGDGQPAKHICDGCLCGSNLPGGHCWQLLSLPSPRNDGSFSSRVPFLGKGNGVNCELGTGKFSQRKAMVNLQNIFVMEVFVVQSYPVTVGFHYSLQGIEPLMISFFGKGNGVNCELGTGKFSQRKSMVSSLLATCNKPSCLQQARYV